MANHLIYCGTYTDPSQQAGFDVTPAKPIMGMTGLTGSKGIYVFAYDPKSGALQHLHAVEGIVNPSFLTLDRAERYLFAVNEVREFGERQSGAVSSFRIDATTGRPELVSQVPSGGGNPCHLAVSPDGQFLLVANHEAGNVSLHRVDQHGQLSSPLDIQTDAPTDPNRKRRSHAHFITPDPHGAFILSSNTGTDRVMIYRLDLAGQRLVPNQPAWGETPVGGSPRHLCFDPTGTFLYTNGESDLSLSVFRYEVKRGTLHLVDHVPTLPNVPDTRRFTTAQVAMHPGGRSLYVSNRGHDSISVFRRDPASGKVTWLAAEPTRGNTPRNFAIDPSGRWLLVANQNSDAIERFAIDPTTGLLTHTGRVANVPAPTSLLFTQT